MSGVPFDDDWLDALGDHIRSRTGLKLRSDRRQDLESGAKSVMAELKISDPGIFRERIGSDAQAFDALVSAFTVGETYFFREPDQFALLRQRILPELRRLRPPGAPLRLWSVGCATGEEPYSLAILLEEEGLADHARILGTDICRARLAQARRGVYKRWSLRGDLHRDLAPYFEPQGEHYALASRFRDRVQFRYLNLVGEDYPSSYSGTAELDVIFCRNVLIYLEHAAVERVAQRLYAALADGGWLITAPSDPPLWDYAPFATEVTPAGVICRRGGATTAPRPASFFAPIAAPFILPPLPAEPQTARTIAAPPPAPESEQAPREPLAAAQAALLIGDFTEAVRLTDDIELDREGWSLRIRALANLGDRERTENAAAAAIAAQTLAPELHYLHAIVLLDRGRLAEAAQALRRVVYIDSSLAVAHFTLGSVLQRRGATGQALSAFRNALALSTALPADEILPLSEGEPAGRMADAARAQLDSLAAEMERAG
jgi:chemotaxis protein methyltransferase CheR